MLATRPLAFPSGFRHGLLQRTVHTSNYQYYLMVFWRKVGARETTLIPALLLWVFTLVLGHGPLVPTTAAMDLLVPFGRCFGVILAAGVISWCYRCRHGPWCLLACFLAPVPLGRNYNFSKFKGDLIAGLTIASLYIPQDIGYAKLANLPGQYGLYSSFVPPLIYAFMGSSRDIAILMQSHSSTVKERSFDL
ncbi:hypothetical protein IFM89_016583 [Coptis chinensis]|uniref:SLC26A/SulP transporter domain-containing protein n=1 Tax=Coptis chinensis TaxID=261450 RepID=A0A835I3M2_9MAGN|nr:hypothetical protein IFM89_016583 [Coptis chinensis]